MRIAYEFSVKDGVLDQTSFVPRDEVQILSSIYGTVPAEYYGTLLNPDVIQLMTPASIRREHPIATLLACDMAVMPDFNNLAAMARTLGWASGAFLFKAVSKLEDRIILCIKNLPLKVERQSRGKLAVVSADTNNSTLYMIGWGETTIEFVDVPIADLAPGAKLFISEKYKDDWPIKAGLKRGTDTRITYTQLDYEYTATPRDSLRAAQALLKAVKFADELEDPNLTTIVASFDPANFDLLTAVTLTRLVYVASNLEIPP